jgi:hypothetical protein
VAEVLRCYAKIGMIQNAEAAEEKRSNQ